MQVVKTVAALRCAMELFRSSAAGITIGLVPTMGALHEGHRSLMTRARSQCGRVVVSIFVNPLQFGPQEDLERYPRNLAADLALCEAAGVDLVFVPTPAALGVADRTELTQVVPPDSLANVLCGRSRPGHFQGVTTIVTKLLNVVQPDLAFFGQKDAQQVAILRRLVADLNCRLPQPPLPPLAIQTRWPGSVRSAMTVSSSSSMISVPKGTFITMSSPDLPVFWLPMPGWPDLAKKCCW